MKFPDPVRRTRWHTVPKIWARWFEH